MSHRVTVRTEIKDKTLAMQALKSAGMAFTEVGETGINVTSGTMRGAHIDLRTGVITGDTDRRHNQKSLGALRQHYGEAKFRKEALKQGHQIESRQVLQNGTIRLICVKP